MDFNPDAELDTSQISDDRGTGGGGGGGLGGRVAVGGGGVSVVGLLIYFLLSQLGGGGGAIPGGLSGLPSSYGDSRPSRGAGNVDLKQKCAFGRDISTTKECEFVATVNSIQAYWTDQLARSGNTYRPAQTHFFQGSEATGCGPATADTGPFYCPADKSVYIDLSFYDELESKFGAQGGPFARAYVLAHEYGHHVQDLIGTSARVKSGRGPTSDSVRLELQADCYAGAWANHATQTTSASGKPLISNISQDDVRAALDTASRIGDDYIQKNLGGGQVNQSQFTHGSSAQREKWFSKGLSTGNPAQCNTFAGNLG